MRREMTWSGEGVLCFTHPLGKLTLSLTKNPEVRAPSVDKASPRRTTGEKGLMSKGEGRGNLMQGFLRRDFKYHLRFGTLTDCCALGNSHCPSGPAVALTHHYLVHSDQMLILMGNGGQERPSQTLLLHIIRCVAEPLDLFLGTISVCHPCRIRKKILPLSRIGD